MCDTTTDLIVTQTSQPACPGRDLGSWPGAANACGKSFGSKDGPHYEIGNCEQSLDWSASGHDAGQQVASLQVNGGSVGECRWAVQDEAKKKCSGFENRSFFVPVVVCEVS